MDAKGLVVEKLAGLFYFNHRYIYHFIKDSDYKDQVKDKLLYVLENKVMPYKKLIDFSLKYDFETINLDRKFKNYQLHKDKNRDLHYINYLEFAISKIDEVFTKSNFEDMMGLMIEITNRCGSSARLRKEVKK